MELERAVLSATRSNHPTVRKWGARWMLWASPSKNLFKQISFGPNLDAAKGSACDVTGQETR